MAIEVKHEKSLGGGFGPPYEKCFNCMSPTPYWYEPKDVACCPECAKIVNPSDVPSKSEWFSNKYPRKKEGAQ